MASKEKIIRELIEILEMFVREGELEEIEITRKTCPINDMPQVDSHLRVTAITLLTENPQIVIPENVNIFLSKEGKQPLTIEQIAKRIMDMNR